MISPSLRPILVMKRSWFWLLDKYSGTPQKIKEHRISSRGSQAPSLSGSTAPPRAIAKWWAERRQWVDRGGVVACASQCSLLWLRAPHFSQSSQSSQSVSPVQLPYHGSRSLLNWQIDARLGTPQLCCDWSARAALFAYRSSQSSELRREHGSLWNIVF